MQDGSQKDSSGEHTADFSDVESPSRIPFKLGSLLTMKPVPSSMPTIRAKIVGAMEDEFILAENPFSDTDDSFSVPIGGRVACTYFQEGILYKFMSKFSETSFKKVICLRYPNAFEPIKLRRYRRVEVNLEAEGSNVGYEQILNGSIKDISDGGCMIELPGPITMAIGSTMKITFVLPDNQRVKGLQCTVANMRSVDLQQKTRFGLSFSGSETEVSKIREFCEMCTYIKV